MKSLPFFLSLTLSLAAARVKARSDLIHQGPVLKSAHRPSHRPPHPTSRGIPGISHQGHWYFHWNLPKRKTRALPTRAKTLGFLGGGAEDDMTLV